MKNWMHRLVARLFGLGFVAVFFAISGCTTIDQVLPTGTSNGNNVVLTVDADDPNAPPVTVASSNSSGSYAGNRQNSGKPSVGQRLKNFFSRDNQRDTLYRGTAQPRYSGQAEDIRDRGYINTANLNGSPAQRARKRQIDYEGNIKPAGGYRDSAVGADVSTGRKEPKFSSKEKVLLNYQNEQLPTVIQNILGGILGVNHIASSSVEGQVTFRAQQPIAKNQLIPFLSDLLARYNLTMRYFNGIYHIGTPDELAIQLANREVSSQSQKRTRVVRLNKGDAAALAEILSGLLPAGVQVTAAPNEKSLILRGAPVDLASAEDLVNTLVQTGVADQRMAIITLNESPPEQVTAKLKALYQERGLASVTIIPLEARQAILVAARRKSTIREIRRLVRQIDVDLRDVPSLRVIQLTHLSAEEITDQLNEVFTTDGQSAAVASVDTANQTRSNILQASIDRAGSGTDARKTNNDPNSGGQSVQTPSLIRKKSKTASKKRFGNGGSDNGGTALATVGATSDKVSIVADKRNNALLVRSTFKKFKRIREVVSALDTPLSQVVIEATIVEVDINDNLEYGVQAFLEANGITLRSGSSVADPGGGGITGLVSKTFGNLTAKAVLTALQEITNVKVISSPYLTVVDGGTSRLSVGDQIPFTTASQTSNSNGTVTVTQEVETRDTGIILTVSPRIRPDNSVLLDIVQEVSAARAVVAGQSTNPIISQRNIKSQIRVDSGATVLLGGLIQERSDSSETGVPVLRKIPVIGGLFSQKKNRQIRSELLVMITPKVVRRSSQLEHLTKQLRWYSNSN